MSPLLDTRRVSVSAEFIRRSLPRLNLSKASLAYSPLAWGSARSLDPRKHWSTVVIAVVALILLTQLAHANTQCNKASLNSTFGFAGMGSIPLRTKDGTVRYDSVSHVGIAAYDGQGNVTVSVKVQFEGKTSPFSFIGTYDVSANCEGTATFKDNTDKVVLVWGFVLVHGGDAIETMALRSPSQTRPMYSLTFRQEKR